MQKMPRTPYDSVSYFIHSVKAFFVKMLDMSNTGIWILSQIVVMKPSYTKSYG